MTINHPQQSRHVRHNSIDQISRTEFSTIDAPSQGFINDFNSSPDDWDRAISGTLSDDGQTSSWQFVESPPPDLSPVEQSLGSFSPTGLATQAQSLLFDFTYNVGSRASPRNSQDMFPERSGFESSRVPSYAADSTSYPLFPEMSFSDSQTITQPDFSISAQSTPPLWASQGLKSQISGTAGASNSATIHASPQTYAVAPATYSSIPPSPLNFSSHLMSGMNDMNMAYDHNIHDELQPYHGLGTTYQLFSSSAPYEPMAFSTAPLSLPMHPSPQYYGTSGVQSLSQFHFTNSSAEQLRETMPARAGPMEAEDSKVGSSRRKKMRTNTANDSSTKGSYSTFRLTNSPSSESDNERSVDRKVVDRSRGGRRTGMHLPPEKAQQVKERRERVACWTCALQRDTCLPCASGGQHCDRCTKRQMRNIITSSNDLGCVAEHLYAYTQHFVPHHFNQVHDESKLNQFAYTHISSWYYDEPIQIRITPAYGSPPIECQLNEFEPKGEEPITQRFGVLDASTNKMVYREVRVAPWALKQLTPEDTMRFDKYFAALAENQVYMKKFPDYCYREQKDDFLRRLLEIMVEYKAPTKKEATFVTSVKKMLLLMYCFGRTCLVFESDQPKLGKLRHFNKDFDYYTRTLPRLANRQLKHMFLVLLRKSMDRVLKTLDISFRSSTGSWTTAFYGMLGLAMAFEDMESSVAMFLKTDVKLEAISSVEAEAHLRGISKAIEEKYIFFRKLFRCKHKFNPFDCRDSAQREERLGRLGQSGAQMAEAVGKLIREKHESYLMFRQLVQVSMDNMEEYHGHLVSSFLCSFFGPDQ